MTFDDLKAKSQTELDELFRASPPGPIPQGDAAGEAIVWPGTAASRLTAKLVHDLAWQGKIFTPNATGDGATLENKITATGIHAIVARVYYTPSWLDGKTCIVLDYSQTSLVARPIRDEIRLVDPINRIYLGKVWFEKTRLVDFALNFPT